MKPIVITPGKYETLPARLKGRTVTVEVDEDKNRLYPELGRHYRVLVDGVTAGSISGKIETMHVTVGRIRHDTGRRMQWRGRPTGVHGRGLGYARDSRAAAALAVADEFVGLP